jgi:hypothetical protein
LGCRYHVSGDVSVFSLERSIALTLQITDDDLSLDGFVLNHQDREHEAITTLRQHDATGRDGNLRSPYGLRKSFVRTALYLDDVRSVNRRFKEDTMKKRLILLGLVAMVAATALRPAMASHLHRSFPLRLNVSQLAPLDGAFYEVWVVFGERKISAGSFNVSEDGELVDGFGHPARFHSPRNPARADAIVVTIEPLPDDDVEPSGIAVLAGTPRDDRARLRFPTRLGSLEGSFILATPTDSEPSNETSGVWFLDPATGPGPSLTLPDLPDNWVWEGWAVTQGSPLSSGRFTSASGADNSSSFSGPLEGPAFPGEDFVANLPPEISPPVDLADGSSTIVLTIEPDLVGTDPTGAGPFSIKPALADVPLGAADHQSISLVRDLSTVPRGRASF